ncbi:MAG: TadE/TadG family type IV pilus assembly protein [Myxococcales bacterium]
MSSLARETRGAVMVETLIAFVPLFILFLGILQLALLAAARLVVSHAAAAGARAAVVVLDDDPRHYDGAAVRDISDNHGDDDAGRHEHASLERLGVEQDAPPPSLGGPRVADIRRAVHARLAAIAPPPDIVAAGLTPTTAARALGPAPLGRLAFGLGVYLPLATAVTFPDAPGSGTLQRERVEGELITVRVTYAMPCVVPLVSRLICSPYRFTGRGAGGALARWLAGDGGGDLTPAERELRLAPAAQQQDLLTLSRVPVRLLRAEATLPAQPAPAYYHRSEDE